MSREIALQTRGLTKRPGKSSARIAAIVLLISIPGMTRPVLAFDLPVECTVPGVALADLRVPFDLALARSGEAVLIRFDSTAAGHSHLLLRMPGCSVLPLQGGPLPPGVHPLAVRPGGARLAVSARFPEGRREWWYSPLPEIPLGPAPPSDGGTVAGQPILSEDGTWAAWVQQKPGSGLQTWHARELRGAGMRSGDTSPLGAGAYEALGYDQKSGILTLARNGVEILDVDTESGRIQGDPIRLGDVSSQPRAVRKLGNGWFAWDAYRDDAPWRAVWSVGGRAGRYDADWSKLIAAAAVNPSGTYAALSLDTRFGRIPLGGEAIVLVRLADGKEVFRKKLPRFTRSRVEFLGDRYLVWMEHGGVVVARMPD